MTILLGFSAVVNRSPVLDCDTEIVVDNASYNTAGSWSEGVMMEAKCDWITDMTLSIWTNHLNINLPAPLPCKVQTMSEGGDVEVVGEGM